MITQESPEDTLPKIYSERAIGSFTFLVTTIFGAVLLRQNLKDIGKKKLGNIVLVASILYSIIFMAIVSHFIKGHVTGVAGLFNGIGTLSLLAVYRAHFSGQDYPHKSTKKPLIIALIMVALLIALAIYSAQLETTQKAVDSAIAYQQKGVSELQEGKFPEAIDDLTKAIAAVPPTFASKGKTVIAEIYLERASAKAQSGDVAGALDDTTQSITLDPTAKIAYRARAGYYLMQHNTDKALPDLTQAISLDPQNTETPKNGLLYLLRGVVEAALSHKDLACADLQKIQTSELVDFDANQSSAYKQLENFCK